MQQIQGIADIQKHLLDAGYITDETISTSLYFAELLSKPILLEGPAGVGKTEIAKVLAHIHQTELIRLQCYEGLDVHHAIYEWNYQRQLLYIKLSEIEEGLSREEKEQNIFSEKYLFKRPLFRAISAEKPVVLLIDEMDRADEEFESYLLEILSDWQLSIPEMGTFMAKSIPHVVVTSNRTRELSDALKRRCLYCWIDYPDYEKELAILRLKIPGIEKNLVNQIVTFMQEIRQLRLEKVPGIAESLEWAAALSSMHVDHLEKDTIESTLGIIIKDWKDMRETRDALSDLLEKVRVESRLE